MGETSPGSATVARSGFLMASGTMVSRILGLVRMILLAAIIGTVGLTADAFNTANTLPNQFYELLAGGFLNAILVPQIVRASTHDDGGEEFVNRIITLSVAAFAALTVVVTLLAPALMWVMFRTRSAEAFELGVIFAFICLPQLFFYAMTTVLGQVLVAHDRFAAYGWAPVIANVVVLAALVTFLVTGQPRHAPPGEWTPTMIALLAGSATLSIAIQAAFLVIPLRRMGWRYRPVWGVRGVGLGAASHVARWTFLAVVVSQLGFVVTTNVLTRATDLGSRAGEVVGGLATFQNAYLLFIVAHSVITVSLVTALFPRMSRAAHEGDDAGLAAYLRHALRLPAVLLVPGIAVGVAFGPLVTASFFPGNDRAQTTAVALIMVPLLLGLLPFGWFYLANRFWYAHEDARTPFRIQLLVPGVAVATTLAAALLPPRWTGSLVGLGQAMAYAAGAVFGFALIRRRLGRVGLRSVVTAYAKLLVPAAVTAGTLAALVHVALPQARQEWGLGVAVLAAASVVTLGVTLATAHRLGVSEVGELLGPLVRRVRRR